MVKMASYQYRKFIYGDKMDVTSSHLHNGNSYTANTAPSYLISPLLSILMASIELLIEVL